MKSSFKRLGDFIHKIDVRNKNSQNTKLLGLSMNKEFRPHASNIIGTDLSRYKIVDHWQFACDFMSTIRVRKLPVVLQENDEQIIVSPAYTTFEVIDPNELHPEYLMMWFRRDEFDRYAYFCCDSAVRGGFNWDELCDVKLPVPSIEKQRELVKEYNTIVNRIKLNEQLNQKLEETAQALYKHWFVDFEFPSENRQPYKSSGGKMVDNEELDQEIPYGWFKGQLSDISDIIMGQSPSGNSYNKEGHGEIFYQGRTEFGFRFPEVRNYTTEPKRRAKKGDILMSVRAPVGDLNIANSNCCIGRGVASLRSKNDNNSFLFYLMKDVKRQFDIANEEGTVFGSITKDGLHEIEIIIPASEVILKFNQHASRLDQKIENQCSQIFCLEQTKKLILSTMSKVDSLKTEQVS